ncbi:MAG: uracil-DNA glycosylase [Actinomycetes bacterium]
MTVPNAAATVPAVVARAHAAAAQGASDWSHLAAVMTGCTACPELTAHRQTVVVGAAGRRDSSGRTPLVLVGEAPGAQEDEAGEPFVGRSGQLLDRLLAGAGLSRPDVGILNVVRCRPPANRTPRRPEIVQCRPWLDRQLELLAPRLVVALGGTAVGELLGRGTRISEVRGEVRGDGRGFDIIGTYHPSAALRFGPKGAPALGLAEDLRLAATHLRGAA